MKLDNSLTADNINQNLLNIEYAVRGPILQRALQIERELAKGVPKPFERVVRANIGDCHALGQKPITFIRQVVALAACPALADSADVPADVKQRAREILGGCTSSSVGAYSPSAGLHAVRARAAHYIAARDHVPASADDIFLGSGASDVIKSVLTMFVEPVGGKPPAVMIPVPQYPLFSGTLSELGLRRADYFLDEDNDWALQTSELQRCWSAASEHSHVRALVVINPGNPTGQVLTRQNMEEIIKFAFTHNLFLLADEVYQENIVCKPFYSFKKVMHEMGAPYSGMELASFLTCSKGWAAECGLRAGYVELLRLQPRVAAAFSTARAVMQCPSVLGQCILDCVMKPPAAGEPSYPLFAQELGDIQRVLAERTETAYETFNSIPGYFCNPIDGSMFAYPRVITDLNKLGLDAKNIPMIESNVDNRESLKKALQMAKVVINCTGPNSVLSAPIVEASIESGTHYLDISAEMFHILQLYQKYNKSAEEASVLVVPSCGYAAIPTESAMIYLERQFKGTLYTVECYTALDIPKRTYIPGRALIHNGTWTSLVYVLESFKDHLNLWKELFPKPVEPVPEEMNKSFFHRHKGETWFPYPGTENYVVDMSQRYLHEKTQKKPVHFKAYTTMPSFIHFIVIPVMYLYYYLSYFKCFRSYLINFPRLATIGYASQKGPTERTRKDTKYSFTLNGKGWDIGADLNTEPTKKMSVKVSGSDPGYDTTAIAIIMCAITILKEGSNIPKGGVVMPGAAFYRTDIVDRLMHEGYTYEVLGAGDSVVQVA